MTTAPPHPWPSLQRAVREARISYTKLAELVGISRQSVTAYARGDRHPSEDTIAALARALDVPYDELRADVPFATSPQDMLDEIDGLVLVLDSRLKTVTDAVEAMKAKREQLQQLVQVPA
jgi:transcriptional regulator with XRE-family HTH domain